MSWCHDDSIPRSVSVLSAGYIATPVPLHAMSDGVHSYAWWPLWDALGDHQARPGLVGSVHLVTILVAVALIHQKLVPSF